MVHHTPDDRMGAMADLAEDFELADVYVFGSRAAEFVQGAGAEGDRPPDIEPDLDLGVRPIMGRRLSARRRAELVVAIEDLFGVPRADLVILPEAPPFLALAVISGELIYCRDSTDQSEYELYVLRRAGDLAPFEHERRAHLLGKPVTPPRLDAAVITDRLDSIDRMLGGIRELPREPLEAFTADAQSTAAAESYLRRSLEALLDLGRHILAKGFGEPAAEYKAIATGLERHGVLDASTARLLRTLAGYRNRIVHFYHELSAEELHDICKNQLGDLEGVRGALLEWIRANPERIDRAT